MTLPSYTLFVSTSPPCQEWLVFSSLAYFNQSLPPPAHRAYREILAISQRLKQQINTIIIQLLSTRRSACSARASGCARQEYLMKLLDHPSIHPLVCYTFNWRWTWLNSVAQQTEASTNTDSRPRGRRIARRKLGQCQSITSTRLSRTSPGDGGWPDVEEAWTHSMSLPSL